MRLWRITIKVNIFLNTENNIQKAVHKVIKPIKDFNMIISTQKL